MDIRFEKAATLKAKPADETKLGFGHVFTDYMFIMDYKTGKGWHDARIVPYGNLELSPAALCLHYGQEVFEGLKAYRRADGGIQLFRPTENFKRLNSSNGRLVIPELPEDMEKRYPPRSLPEGAKVTRFAPSPTGFVHFGGLFPTKVAERLAHTSGGVCYLRIEDTDSKREVPGAAEALVRTLAMYGVTFDEGISLDENGNITEHGDYGPYKQSERVPIYHVYAKQLVREGKAYPCFTSEEELEELEVGVPMCHRPHRHPRALPLGSQRSLKMVH